MNKVSLASLFFAVFFLISKGYAAPPLSQTQNKLKTLTSKIQKTRQDLVSTHTQRKNLHNNLAETEKEIGNNIQLLKKLQDEMNTKQTIILGLETKIEHLNDQLAKQREQLAKHVKTRYIMGEYQPLKWLINQESPYEISRVLTYYHYLIQSRQTLIADINATRKNLVENKDQLNQEIALKNQLQLQLNHQQQVLNAHKQDQNNLVRELDQQIQSQEAALKEYERDKTNLSHILDNLKEQIITQPSNPFASMRKKLPHPIQYSRAPVQKMKQGVTFFAGEGTPVLAVYPGKVVFSDWLKGYGLLLIIDHGQGFMTLYAHNQSLFKHKGQSVKQNEQIASVGHSGGIKQNGLYFEVRQRGKAIYPLQWLS